MESVFGGRTELVLAPVSHFGSWGVSVNVQTLRAVMLPSISRYVVHQHLILMRPWVVAPRCARGDTGRAEATATATTPPWQLRPGLMG